MGLTGTGEDRAELLVDPATGALVEGESTSSATMELRGAGDEVELRQRVTVRVRRVE